MTTTATDSETLLAALLQRHHSDDRRDCGARTEEMACKGSRHGHTHVRHCTKEPDHVEQHQDALHCWSFERFDEDVVIDYRPRDLASCITCNVSWPCPEAEFLEDFRTREDSND